MSQVYARLKSQVPVSGFRFRISVFKSQVSGLKSQDPKDLASDLISWAEPHELVVLETWDLGRETWIFESLRSYL